VNEIRFDPVSALSNVVQARSSGIPESSSLTIQHGSTVPNSVNDDSSRSTDLLDISSAALQQFVDYNAQSMQNSNLNEATISKMIERNQLSVLSGNTSRPPANFFNQDPVSRAIEANSLTVHSIHSFDLRTVASEMSGGNIYSKPESLWRAYGHYLWEATGKLNGTALVFSYFLVHGLRLLSGKFISSFN